MTFKAPNRLLAMLIPSKRRCGNCKYFDLALGQEERANSGIFAQVALVVPPSKVSGSLAEGEEYTPPTKDMPRGVSWNDFGACTHPDNEGVLIWAGDTTAEKWA